MAENQLKVTGKEAAEKQRAHLAALMAPEGGELIPYRTLGTSRRYNIRFLQKFLKRKEV